MAALPRLSPTELAQKLVADGPHKQEPAKRRIRGLLGGNWIFDTLDAQYVWEHPYFPVYYVPMAALATGHGEVLKQNEDGAGFWTGSIVSGGQTAEATGYDKGPLEGLVKIKATDAAQEMTFSPDQFLEWFAEDEKLLGGHPKDPYKRIEILPSTREIRIEVDGVVVAQSEHNMFLYETMLRTRYYLPITAVRDVGMLRKSDTTTFCPYKGQASYYSLTVGDKTIPDAVWYYTYPTHESAAVQGRLCFYNEKVDVFIDGKKEAK